MESASQPTSFLLARSCSITSSLPAANVMHPSAALCAGPSCSSVASGRTPIWAAVTPACTAQGRVVTHSRFGEGSRHALGLVLAVGVTSMYSVITGRRVNLLSLGPSLYSVTRSTASATYDSGARNSSGCSCGVIGVDAAAAASGCRGAISTRSVCSGRVPTSIVFQAFLSRQGSKQRPSRGDDPEVCNFQRKFHAFAELGVASRCRPAAGDAGARRVQQALCALRSFDDALRAAASSCECHRDSVLRSRRHSRAVPRCVLGDRKAVQEGHEQR